MEELKSFLKTIIYFELALGEENKNLENAMKRFYENDKDYYENVNIKVLRNVAPKHPACESFDEIKNLSNEEFDKLRKETFLKICAYIINNSKKSLDYIDDDKEVQKLIEDISEIKLENLKYEKRDEYLFEYEFIKENLK